MVWHKAVILGFETKSASTERYEEEILADIYLLGV